MLKEKSAGVIVFRRHHEQGIQYLVMYHHGEYWNFPKGHIEEGESEIEAALRELEEEAGVTGVKIIEGFRDQTQFMFKEKHGLKAGELIRKDFIIYLAEAAPGTDPKISHEHNGFAWLTLPVASKYIKFKNLKDILAEAEEHIKSLK